jgi:hypothetical protein
MNSVHVQSWRRRAGILLAAVVATAGLSAPARAQEAINKEAAAAAKAAFIADLDVVKGKYLGLAEAFPADKYSWRPMEGVRSVSEVLVLVASEGYALLPTAFGGKAGASRDEMAAMSHLTDKAKIIEQLNKAFAHARSELEALDPAQMTGKRPLFGQSRNALEVAFALGGDLHEHLGQLIAYARTNHIVPPWSK